jgi:hypothetical protein
VRKKAKNVFAIERREENGIVDSLISFCYDNIKMLTFFKEKTSSVMGNAPTVGEKQSNGEYDEDSIFKTTLHVDGLTRRQSVHDLIFFAGTDKARV